jgi:hypothetical protein
MKISQTHFKRLRLSKFAFQNYHLLFLFNKSSIAHGLDHIVVEKLCI